MATINISGTITTLDTRIDVLKYLRHYRHWGVELKVKVKFK